MLDVYNMLGEAATAVIDETIDAGSHTVTFDALGTTYGVSLCRMGASGYCETKRVVWMR